MIPNDMEEIKIAIRAMRGGPSGSEISKGRKILGLFASFHTLMQRWCALALLICASQVLLFVVWLVFRLLWRAHAELDPIL